MIDKNEGLLANHDWSFPYHCLRAGRLKAQASRHRRLTHPLIVTDKGSGFAVHREPSAVPS